MSKTVSVTIHQGSAAAIKGAPYRDMILRGRKGQADRLVVQTNMFRIGAEGKYYLCLVPYSDEEMRNRRRQAFYHFEPLFEGVGPAHVKTETVEFDRRMHELWVNESRLKEVKDV